MDFRQKTDFKIDTDSINDTSNHLPSASDKYHSIREVKTVEEFQAVLNVRKAGYKNIYPEMEIENDIFDENAINLFTRNTLGDIATTARLVHDSPNGLPLDPFLKSYRDRGLRLIELGRFICLNSDLSLLKAYYRKFYNVALQHSCDAIVMAMKPKDIAFHQRITGISILTPDTGRTYGGQYSLACVAWDISDTKPKFFEWTGEHKDDRHISN